MQFLENYLSASIRSTLDAIVEEEMKNNKLPGVSVAIVADQSVIWAKGFGYANVTTKETMTTDTIFAVGSITKLITATMLMQLRDSGKINLDDPVHKHLPALKLQSTGKNGRPITIRQIASHTAGLPREISFEGWHTLEFPTTDKFLEEMKDMTTIFPPLSRYKYSNLGYTILGQVLSLVAGVPFKDYVLDNILKPLGMNRSGFDVAQLPVGLAAGYTVFGNEPIEKVPYLNFGAMAPAGQLFSSVLDMSRFVSLQFVEEDSGTATDEGKIRSVLEPATVREMHMPVYIGKRWVGGTGIGWHITRALAHTISSHRGGIPGFTTDIVLDRDIKLGVIVFTNAFPQPNEIAVRIVELLVPVIGAVSTDHGQSPSDQVGVEAFGRYTGRYKSKYFGEIEIRITKGRLVMSDLLAPQGVETILMPAGMHRFIMGGGDEDGEFAIFEVGNDGSVKSVNTAGYRFDR